MSGTCLHTLRLERGYERTDITGLTGITEAQRTALLALGAFERPRSDSGVLDASAECRLRQPTD